MNSSAPISVVPKEMEVFLTVLAVKSSAYPLSGIPEPFKYCEFVFPVTIDKSPVFTEVNILAAEILSALNTKLEASLFACVNEAFHCANVAGVPLSMKGEFAAEPNPAQKL